MNTVEYDIIIVGAGAAGLMAALTAGKRGRNVLLIEHTNKIGEKIRISGGGRCNFTNLHASPKNYLSQNPCFIISALSRYTQYDFIKLVESYNISYHEKTLGQLFCDGSATQIINMLIAECKMNNVTLLLNCSVLLVTKNDKFSLKTRQGIFQAQSLVVASGGLAMPKLGSSDFGYQIARQFGLQIVVPRPALVPLTVADANLELFKNLSGISIPSVTFSQKTYFRENILFTHRGLSGPAILQISSYLKQPKQSEITINLLPEIAVKELFMGNKKSKSLLSSFLKEYLPKRFLDNLSVTFKLDKRIVDCKSVELERIAYSLQNFVVKIGGTEGYMKAEVTAGGIDTNELLSKTMESNKVPGLFFIGEVVDVTGWLGGYNFQWAWSSGYVAGLYA